MRASGAAGEVPRQVPSGPLRFVNREVELAAVSELVADRMANGSRIAVCTGLPGVGKSALVRKAVEQVRSAFPGGELLVEFGSADSGGISVDDALASCLLALGVADSVMPAGFRDRVNLYRTKTAVAPMLVVLDDVADPAQVTPLVPRAAGSVVLVTSTARLTELQLDGAQLVQVEPLDDVSGTRMLRELCGPRVDSEPGAVTSLVRECGGLPVVLRAAAARLLGRRSLTVAQLVDDIAAERRGLVPARGQDQTTALFALIYRQLPEETARMYRVLGGLPGPDASVAFAAAAFGASVQAGGELLADLVEAGLVQEMADGRLRMHQTVRRHAVERGLAEDTDQVRAASVRLAIDELLVQVAFADRAVLGTGRYRCTPHDQLLAGRVDPFAGEDARPRALSWLAAERANLAAGVRACTANGWHDLAWQLAESATALYVTRRYLVDWTDTSELGADAAAVVGNVAAEARLRSFSSRPWTERGDLARARRELDTAAALARNVDDVRLRASIHEMDGRYHDVAGDFTASTAAFRHALDLFRSVGDRRGEAFVSSFLGAAQYRAGEHYEALRTSATALELINSVGDARMAGRTMINLADVHVAVRETEQAGEWLARAIDVLEVNGDLFHEAQARMKLADLELDAGDVESARRSLRRARDLHFRLGSARVDELERKLVALSPS